MKSTLKQKYVLFTVVALKCVALSHTETLASEEKAFDLVKPGEPKLVHFAGALPVIKSVTNQPQFWCDLTKETFEVFVPTNYPGKEPFGLFTFIDSQNETRMPGEWALLMEKNRLICLIPQRVGNDQPLGRRLGLTLIGILKIAELCHIDPKRVFTIGYSGGARCSLHLALLHSDLIAGNISICGGDFYEPVPQAKATDVRGYGVWPVPADCAAEAKTKTRLTFITGSEDFRRGNILDIYEGGFIANHFHAKLIDVPGLGHQLCKPEVLQDAIGFLDNEK